LSYEYEIYTLDTKVSTLVNNVFKKLYDAKLIYQDYKLVNWDVKLQSAISDIEVIHKPTTSKMYYCKYILHNHTTFLPVATTRPETMFGDVCLFVNPRDTRYTKFINQEVINPVNQQLIKVFADSYVDMNFGTGVMKCTPAHDFNDYQLAQKHHLQYHSIMSPNGQLNQYAKPYDGLDRLQAREKIIDDLSKQNLLIKVDTINNEIGYSERTGEIVEPLLSKQWFIKVQPLVKKVIKLMSEQPSEFLPSRFKHEAKR
jgi:valyl-tRNA synthetase